MTGLPAKTCLGPFSVLGASLVPRTNDSLYAVDGDIEQMSSDGDVSAGQYRPRLVNSPLDVIGMTHGDLLYGLINDVRLGDPSEGSEIADAFLDVCAHVDGYLARHSDLLGRKE
jgi:hypothetical protein